MSDITKNAEFLWNITTASHAFGVSRDTMRKRIKVAGVMPSGKRSGHQVYSVADLSTAVRQDSAEGLNDSKNPMDYLPKDRKDWYQSESERVKLLEKTGELISESDYREDMYKTLSKVVSFFEGLVDQMERTGQFSPEQLEILEVQSDGFRNQLHLSLIEASPDD